MRGKKKASNQSEENLVRGEWSENQNYVLLKLKFVFLFFLPNQNVKFLKQEISFLKPCDSHLVFTVKNVTEF